MLYITRSVRLHERELEFSAIRSSGPGGQNVNKVSSAVQLRFDIRRSSLPPDCKRRVLALPDRRISKDGVIVIKAQRFRDREKNRADAIERLRALLASALAVQAKRIPTKATVASKRRRLDEKVRRGRDKRLRRKVRADD